ncbi:MAG: alpha-L-fucosidase [Bacteroidetes bacterium]|nr:alpha-L-fucosidase [Bacteroidota bacterium]
MKITFLLVILLIGITLIKPLMAQDNKKMEMWNEDKFGLFLHWGVYSKIAGEWKGRTDYSEFVMLTAKIPIKEYEAIASTFNPEKFDAEKWVLAAKSAGMKYVVYTSKHHEGFAMYHSNSSPYNIFNFTPFKRDPLKELAEACRKHHIKLGIYYSLGRDWHDPDVPTVWPYKGGRSNTWDFPNEDAKDISKYYERKVKPQVKELMMQYKPAIMWFDTPEMIKPEQSKELRAIILKINPNCIIDDRIGNSMGDFATIEQKGSNKIIKPFWESCITMSKNWGYMHADSVFKSPEKLIGLLVDIASKGGNLLLNVGPTPEGEIRLENLERLKTIGKWMSVNGEAIYGTTSWKIYGEDADSMAYKTSEQGYKAEEKDALFDGTAKNLVQDIRFTKRGKIVYIIARSWRVSNVFIKALNSSNQKVVSLSMLGYQAKLKWIQMDKGLLITIPEKAKREVPMYVFKVKFKD